jgi:hypothetical protein
LYDPARMVAMGGADILNDARPDGAGDDDAAATAPPARRRFGRSFFVGWLVGFLVVVLGAEMLVRVSESHLNEPLDYFSRPAQSMVHDMEVLEAHHIRSDLTFVGTSMVRRDIDANRLEVDGKGTTRLATVKWAHNVALPGAQTTLVERWLLEQVVPRLHPKRVVWGISSLDFNSGRPDHPIDLYNAARATDTGIYATLDRAIEHLAISKYRVQLRDPYQVLHTVGNTPERFNVPRPLSERATWVLGYAKQSAKDLAKMRRAHALEIRTRQLRNFTIGKAELDAYKHTLKALQAQHIDVAIVIMPVTDGYLSFHPHGAADYLQWKQVVTDIARADGIPVIDLSRSVEGHDFRYFRDYEHLSPAAAHSFTDLLAGKLRTLGW